MTSNRPPSPSPSRSSSSNRAPTPTSTSSDSSPSTTTITAGTAFPSLAAAATIPKLDAATPPSHKLKSHVVLIAIVSIVVFAAWFSGYDLIQVEDESGSGTVGQVQGVGVGVFVDDGAAATSTSSSWFQLLAVLGTAIVVLVGSMHWTGVAQVDFWALLQEYWWVSVLVTVAGITAVTMMEERNTAMQEVE